MIRWFQGSRHVVKLDADGWRCVHCEAWFDRWPDDAETCPGPKGGGQ